MNGCCYAVSNLCYTWNPANGQCTGCYQGYTLSGGTCVVGSGNNGGNNNNGNTIPNCAQVGANGQCVQCAYRFFLYNGYCQAVSDQCYTWNSANGQCTGCYQGYKLQAGACVIDNSGGSGGGSGNTIPNCAQVGANGQCVQCAYRFYIVNGYCQAVSDQCYTWNSANGQCTGCYQGYVLQGGACVRDNSGGGSNNNVPNCAQVGSNGLCVQCAYRFYNLNGYCQAVSDQCYTWNSANGQCTGCYQGYKLQAGACVIGNSGGSGGGSGNTIPNCAQVGANGQCVQCAYRFYIVNGYCQAVSDQCYTWNSANGQCTGCYQGYTLSGGACLLGGNNNGGNNNNNGGNNNNNGAGGCAQTDSSGFCMLCADRYYQYNGYCRPVSVQCCTYNRANGQCTTCYDGYSLLGGSCVSYNYGGSYSYQSQQGSSNYNQQSSYNQQSMSGQGYFSNGGSFPYWATD